MRVATPSFSCSISVGNTKIVKYGKTVRKIKAVRTLKEVEAKTVKKLQADRNLEELQVKAVEDIQAEALSEKKPHNRHCINCIC